MLLRRAQQFRQRGIALAALVCLDVTFPATDPQKRFLMGRTVSAHAQLVAADLLYCRRGRAIVKLITVRRTAVETYERLSRTFADAPNVQVVWEQRRQDRRTRTTGSSVAERRRHDRRKLTKPWNHQGYCVIHTAEESQGELPPPRPAIDPTHVNLHKLARAINIPLSTLLDFGTLT
jgi:hypothetical protein